MDHCPFRPAFIDHRSPTIRTRHAFNHFAIPMLPSQLFHQLAHYFSTAGRDLPGYLIDTGPGMFCPPVA
jgi:hypothetical protein